MDTQRAELTLNINGERRAVAVGRDTHHCDVRGGEELLAFVDGQGAGHGSSSRTASGSAARIRPPARGSAGDARRPPRWCS
jgi:hypothetical protein